MRVLRVKLTNFLSYRSAVLELGGLTALVGPNASGKSNAVSAIKVLADIPAFGLQTALARRGGFDQLRHRSQGRPYNPAISIEFEVEPGFMTSTYELKLGAKSGKRYEIIAERGHLYVDDGRFSFSNVRGRLKVSGQYEGTHHRFNGPPDDFTVPDGQSALAAIAAYGPLFQFWNLMQGFQVVETNPARLRDFQDPSPSFEMEPDGSNAASVFEQMHPGQRAELIDELAAIVPSLADIEPRHFSNKLTVAFTQEIDGKRRDFLANQMSDGTLRAFGILLAVLQARHFSHLIVIEEPEIAIHLGALRTLIDILRQHSSHAQILITTHSADIIDALDVDQVRVVWSEAGASHLAPIADHTKDTVRSGLITPGELLRSDALDPAIP